MEHVRNRSDGSNPSIIRRTHHPSLLRRPLLMNWALACIRLHHASSAITQLVQAPTAKSPVNSSRSC